MKQRVVFDTSTLVGAILRSESVPDRALDRALELCDLCVSAETFAELESVLAKKRLERYFSSETRRAFVDLIRQHGLIFVVGAPELAKVLPRCRDASDDFVLALAIAAKADVIVSSDQDLLVLHPWRGIAILTPAQFLAQYTV